MTELDQPKDDSSGDENEGGVNSIQQSRPSSLLCSQNFPSLLECVHIKLEFGGQAKKDYDEKLLKRYPDLVDVETFLHLFWRGTSSCHSSSDDLYHETDDVEKNETSGEGSGFDFEDAVGWDVEVDHSAENHV